MRDYEGRNYINGEWLKPTGYTYSKTNPATGKYMGIFPNSSPETVHQAYFSARESFTPWRKLSRFVRSDYMYRVAQIIERRREELA